MNEYGSLVNAGITLAVLAFGGLAIVRLVKHLSAKADTAGERAVQKRLTAGDKVGAARAAYEHEMWARAASLFTDAGRHADAARSYKKAENWENAAQIFEQLSEYESAAWCYRKMQNQRGELEMLKKGQKWSEAAALALTLSRDLEAAELFVRAGERERASELFRKAGESKRAVELAAEVFEERGDFENAARSQAKLENWQRAHDLFLKAEKPEMAAKALIRSGKREEAAKLYETTGKLEIAAAMFEHLGQFRKAAALYSKVGQTENAIRCLTRLGDRIAVIKLRVARNELDKAIAVAESFDPTEPEFIEATAMAADLREQNDDQAGALKNLRRLLQAPLDPQRKVSCTKRAIELCIDLQQAQLGQQFVEKLESFTEDLDRGWIKSVKTQLGEISDEIPADVGFLTPSPLHATTGGLVRVGDAHGYDLTQSFAEGTVAYVDGTAQSGAKATQFGVETEDDGWPQGVPRALAKRYRDLDRLGQGGNGVVFRATDKLMDRTVVLKFMIEGSMPTEMARKYFLREIKMAASLSHPNIVHIYDMGQEDDIPYYSMEYIEGLPLTAHMPAGKPVSDLNFVMDSVSQLCAALDHAHGKGMIHRDIKPDNVLVSSSGVCKLLDFGLARVLDDGFGENSVLAGTPYYMAPEQIDGSEVDHRADIYALGVIVFRLFTGHLPFTEGNIFVAHALEPVPDPARYNEDLDPAVIEVIYRCMKKDPTERYSTCGELAKALREALSHQHADRPTPV